MFTAAGYLEPIPPYPISVSALVSGRVDEFSILEGTRVKAGDILAKLNATAFEHRVAAIEAEQGVAAAKLAQAEAVLARTEKLAAIGSTPARELQRAKADEVLLPARKPAEKPVLAPDVYVLSDLIFHLAARTPPKVRRSKLEDDSALQRLSFRDLFWYCYLDQDSLDSSFFNLELEGNMWKRLKSLDVLRFLIGFHQEEVSELQVRLQEMRVERERAEGALLAMEDALESIKLGSALQIAAKRAELQREIARCDALLAAVRANTASVRGHALDEVRRKAQQLAAEILAIDTACHESESAIAKDSSHRNELEFLSLRYKRASTASAVLRGVQFVNCPKCTQMLPARAEAHCAVCGQPELSDASQETPAVQKVDADTRSRMQELDDMIARQRDAVSGLREERDALIREKGRLDGELTRLSENYDSIYLSNALESEMQTTTILASTSGAGSVQPV